MFSLKFLKVLSILILIICFSNKPIKAQGVSINTTGARADTSAMLDISCEFKGLLIPRLNERQRNGIASPANSLIIFNTKTQCLNIFIHGRWKEICGKKTD